MGCGWCCGGGGFISQPAVSPPCSAHFPPLIDLGLSRPTSAPRKPSITESNPAQIAQLCPSSSFLLTLTWDRLVSSMAHPEQLGPASRSCGGKIRAVTMDTLPLPVTETEERVVLDSVLPVSHILDETLQIPAAIFLTVRPDCRPRQLEHLLPIATGDGL